MRAIKSFRITLDDYGAAIRAAYEEGYIEGASHPPRFRVIAKAKQLAVLFWRAVESRLPA